MEAFTGYLPRKMSGILSTALRLVSASMWWRFDHEPYPAFGWFFLPVTSGNLLIESIVSSALRWV